MEISRFRPYCSFFHNSVLGRRRGSKNIDCSHFGADGFLAGLRPRRESREHKHTAKAFDANNADD